MCSLDLLKETEALEEALKCLVCDELLNDPVVIGKCGHTLCKICFHDHDDLVCPVCRIPLSSGDSVEDKEMKLLVELVKELRGVLVTESVDDTAQNDMEFKTPGRVRRKRKSSVADDTIVMPSLSDRSPNVSARLSRGNLEKKNPKGETLLHRAVITGNATGVRELLQLGANPNVKDYGGWTPLHEASNHGHLEIAEQLLDHGVLVNVPGGENMTPLHDAVRNGNMEIAKLLVSKGADLYARTSYGKNALDLCKDDSDREILTNACTQVTLSNLNSSSVSLSTEADGNIVFLSTGLNDYQSTMLKKCAQALDAEIVENYENGVTHIVVACDEKGNCVRTKKLLMGILDGKWIVNYQWIEVCLEYGEKIDELPFEVQGTRSEPGTYGPKRSRENRLQNLPKLFDGCHFYLHGRFSNPLPDRESLIRLIQQGGGKILLREPKPDVLDEHRIPYHAQGTVLEDSSRFILYQDNAPRCESICTGHICTVQVLWLIESISVFKLLTPPWLEHTGGLRQERKLAIEGRQQLD